MLHQLLVGVKKPFIKMVPVPTPQCVEGAGSVAKVGELCQQYHVSKPLIVTDNALVSLGIAQRVISSLQRSSIPFAMYDDVVPDPNFDVVREGVNAYRERQCDGIIALGGGSPMDCAKAIAASVRTGKDVARLTGLFRVHRPLMPIIAIPTTAGTGSETTVAAVVSDEVAKKKLAITDPFLVPKVAILDAELMLGLPVRITAETGIDALTHAIESYLSGYANSYTKALSVKAIQAIFEYLPKAVENGSDIQAREKMAKASFDAGVAFTRTYIGYVHAIAHQLGAFYHVPHGQANAIVLPHVLRFIAEQNHVRLRELAAHFCDDIAPNPQSDIVSQFIEKIERLLRNIGIASTVKELQEYDIPDIAEQAIDEAFGEYPVPVVMSYKQCHKLLVKLLPNGEY
jgi:alcohol dehydrogenase class IV